MEITYRWYDLITYNSYFLLILTKHAIGYNLIHSVSKING